MMNVKTLMMLVMMSMLAVTVSAQRMHKHPRVTVKANKVTLNKKGSKDAEKVMMPATATLMQEENVANAESETLVNEVAVATTETKAEVKNARKNIVNSVVVKDVKQMFDFSTYAQQLKEHSRLMKVKDVEKTALEKWILWMIILFAAALVFSILAVVFFYAITVWALSTIFWILAGLCWLGGLIVLVLGLVGVI